jgi:hypothetical protein
MADRLSTAQNMAYAVDLTTAVDARFFVTPPTRGAFSVRRGTLVVCAMILLGLALAGLSLGVRYRSGDRALEFWTTPVALQISQAPQAELWKLSREQPADELRPPFMHDGQTWQVSAAWDLPNATGFSHARHALLEDASFEFSPEPESEPHWQYAVRLSGQGEPTILLFDLDGARVATSRRAGTLSMAPLAPKLRIFFNDVCATPQAGLVAK